MDPERKPDPAPPPPLAATRPDWSRPPDPGPSLYTGPPTDALGALIPTDNPPALFAYYAGIFSLVVCLAPVLGPMAIYFGVRALRAIRENPQLKGRAHAWTGIVLGGITLLLSLLGILLVAASMLSS